MDDLEHKDVIEQLRQWGVVFDKGLSSREVTELESEAKFRFPDDLKAFLQLALPIWEPDFEQGLYIIETFPNWRTRGALIIRRSQRWLLNGILFQVKPFYDYAGQENGPRGYWRESWGIQPSTWQEAQTVIEREFAQAPILVPVYAHRFIPTEPTQSGNPVFSVMGCDIVHYGPDLATYFLNEFGHYEFIRGNSNSPHIRFWDDFVFNH